MLTRGQNVRTDGSGFAAGGAAPQMGHMPRTILVVDDNGPFRGMLKSMLQMRGYEPVVAASAAEGLQLAAGHAIDAALVDFDMPVTNGIECCRQLREQKQASGRDFPTWIMTGTLDPEVAKGVADVGVLSVLRKPFNTDALCAVLEREFEARSEAGV
jgi:CheY-like chemotaxis protein